MLSGTEINVLFQWENVGVHGLLQDATLLYWGHALKPNTFPIIYVQWNPGRLFSLPLGHGIMQDFILTVGIPVIKR